ncbi:glutamate synthase (NADH) small subunit [Polynucleobacter meluiroseus]|uniref:Glutamate synthase (NADH) small subunit n=1 Tax=Polynucleobacter meluiroseus TaxID=1938814 RepID=A0A240E0C6_9BURK|nr:glutamate synthase subunit beta [Polynucleobacter meluiroseus]SNX28889.1 glutamate synthase (NADH) small subunit [Polynucleobacter meluiroseus]
MGKATGFMEFERVEETYEAPVKRLHHYKEFVAVLTDAEAKVQGARCMDCGIPFCNSGCPVNNIIPDFNDLVFRDDWKNALEVLQSTNNFPEFTGRICPAPCESACTLAINSEAVGIKSIEHAIIDKGWENGWVTPQPPKFKTGKTVAIVGGGPAGMAAAQQLARVGHDVTVFEKNDRVGGLLRYGIPDFKMEKWLIDRRVEQMQAEGVKFETGVFVGREALSSEVKNYSTRTISPEQLMKDFDAVVITGGAEQPRDLPVPGRELAGIHYALELLIPQNKEVAGDFKNEIRATDKYVVVIGGGDTGSDCVGTSNRHGATKVTQFELLPQPPEVENTLLEWPYWPTKLRTSSSHVEGCERDWSVATKRFEGKNGKVEKLIGVRLEWKNGKMSEVPDSEFEIKADLVLLAMGFVSPVQHVLDAFGVEKDARGNAKATVDGKKAYQTNVSKVFAAGDMRRGQSLVVWAIREGRDCAHVVDEYLMGSSDLP